MTTPSEQQPREAGFFRAIREWGLTRGDNGFLGGVVDGLAQRVGMATVPARITQYDQQGILAYPMLQPDGKITLFTGAFESPVQAITLADSLRALGMTPVLAYRTGRAF